MVATAGMMVVVVVVMMVEDRSILWTDNTRG
jgi:hypothetical protein